MGSSGRRRTRGEWYRRAAIWKDCADWASAWTLGASAWLAFDVITSATGTLRFPMWSTGVALAFGVVWFCAGLWFLKLAEDSIMEAAVAALLDEPCGDPDCRYCKP